MELTAVLYSFGGRLLAQIAKEGIQSLLKHPPVERAIDQGCSKFPQFDGLRGQLAEWCTSDQFADLLSRMKAGERDLADGDIVARFVNVAGFHCGDEEATTREAARILSSFFQSLENELYSTGEGLAIHAAREERLHDRTYGEVQVIGKGVANVEQAVLSVHSILGEIAQKLPGGDQEIAKRIDTARDLILQGKAKAAKVLLEELWKEIEGKTISPEVRFRIVTNLGACALQLDKFEEASSKFREAFKLTPGDVKAITNAAYAALLDGYSEDAIRLAKQARELDKTNEDAAFVHLRALYNSKGDAGLDELLREEPFVADFPLCALGIGQIRLDQERFAEAEGYLRRAVQVEKPKPEALTFLAQAISVPIQDSVTKSPPVPGGFSVETRSRLLEAEEYLNSAISVLAERDNPREYYGALLTRAAIYGLLGMTDEAVRDCDRVLAAESVDDALHDAALQNKAVALFQAGDIRGTISAFEHIRDPRTRRRIVTALASAYLADSRPAKAVEALSPVWAETTSKHERLQIADLLMQAYSNLERSAEVERIISDLRSDFPDDPEAMRIIATQRGRKKRWEEAEQLLSRALQLASGNLRGWISINLADLYLHRCRYKEAASYYAPFVDVSKDNPVLRNYLIALFNARSYKKTLELAEQVRCDGPAIPVISEIEARVRELIGDLQGARELLVQLSEAEPENSSHRIHAAYLDYRQGNRGLAEEGLSKVHFEDIKDDPVALIHVAKLKSFLGKTDILEFGFRARQLAFNDPQIHLDYLALFRAVVEVGGQALDVNQADTDTMVVLRRDGEERKFWILPGERSDYQKGYLAPEDSIAKRLVGLKKGDEIQLKTGEFGETPYKVVDVKQKYVAAYQETLSSFTTWFPDHPALHRIEIKENSAVDTGFTQLFAVIDHHQKLVSHALSVYKDGHLTLGALANLIDRSLPETWAGLVSRQDGRIIAGTGKKDDTSTELALLADAPEAVLDVTSVMTITYLSAAEQLKRRFQNIFVPQSVLDVLNQALTHHVFLGPGAKALGKAGERYVLEEYSEAQFQNWTNFLEKARDFVERKCSVVTARYALELGEQFVKLQDLLGGDAIGALLIAQERSIPLYSDDLKVRQIGAHEHGIKSVWSQTILMDLLQKGILLENEYRDMLGKLALANYYFVSVDAEDLFHVLKTNDFQFSEKSHRLMAVLQGPGCDEVDAVRVGARLVKNIFLQSDLLEHQRLPVLYLLLKILTQGRAAVRVISRLKRQLQAEFYLAPTEAQRIVEQVDIWARFNLPKAYLTI